MGNWNEAASSYTEAAKLPAFDGAADDQFGYSVFISCGRAVIGAYGDDDCGTDSSSAYIYVCDDTAWTRQAKLMASDGNESNSFGKSEFISGKDAVIGSPYNDNNWIQTGSGYLYSSV